MDPIHPILPQPPNIPPVLPSTGVGRVDRDGGRGAQGDQDAPAKRQPRAPRDFAVDVDADSDAPAGESTRRIDITA
jgi:hypothetical protein